MSGEPGIDSQQIGSSFHLALRLVHSTPVSSFIRTTAFVESYESLHLPGKEWRLGSRILTTHLVMAFILVGSTRRRLFHVYI